MMSTKTESLNGQLKNPFASSQYAYAGFNNSFGQYKNSYQDNLQLLKRRFPYEDGNKIKDLLEELDNNLEMVTQILLEQQDKYQMVCEKAGSKKYQFEEQNKMLKSAIARLYKKLITQQKELQSLKGSHEKTKRQNEDLKLQNCLLLQREFSKNIFDEERDVY